MIVGGTAVDRHQFGAGEFYLDSQLLVRVACLGRIGPPVAKFRYIAVMALGKLLRKENAERPPAVGGLDLAAIEIGRLARLDRSLYIVRYEIKLVLNGNPALSARSRATARDAR